MNHSTETESKCCETEVMASHSSSSSSSTDSLLSELDHSTQTALLVSSPQSSTIGGSLHIIHPDSFTDSTVSGTTLEAGNQSDTISLTSLQTKFIITLMVVCNFLIANGVSLQGPFYPKEAERKGATPIIYSSIFAIYELVMLVTSFVFGNLVERFKPNLMSGFGLAMTGVSTTVFGVLTYTDALLYFVLFSFVLRITESLGATAFATSSYSFISACFPDRTATMFAVMETFFGLGVITGPVVGGFLYDFGGFLLPFLSTGIVMTVCGVVMISRPVEVLFLRAKQAGQLRSKAMAEEAMVEDGGHNPLTDETTLVDESCKLPTCDQLAAESSPESRASLLSPINDSVDEPQPIAPHTVTLCLFLSSPVILLDSFLIITAITLMGFNGATLEPFVRHQQISSGTLCTSLLFVAIGASYAFTAMLWGKACDRYPEHLLHFAMFGSVVTTVGLVLIGPLPFLQSTLTPSLWSIVVCLVLFGVGTACKQVAAYTHALNHTIQRRRFPSNQHTYGYISGMFFSCLSFGGFIGPILGGSLVQHFSYQYATLVMCALELLVLIVLVVLQLCCRAFR